MFIGIGWAVWSVGALLVLMGIGQILNAFVQLVFQKPIFRWADGLVSALSIAAIFGFLCLFFTQTNLHDALLESLEQYGPLEQNGEDGLVGNENVVRLASEYGAMSSRFNSAIFVAAGVSASIFILSMVRLFSNASNEN